MFVGWLVGLSYNAVRHRLVIVVVEEVCVH